MGITKGQAAVASEIADIVYKGIALLFLFLMVGLGFGFFVYCVINDKGAWASTLSAGLDGMFGWAFKHVYADLFSRRKVLPSQNNTN